MQPHLLLHFSFIFVEFLPKELKESDAYVGQTFLQTVNWLPYYKITIAVTHSLLLQALSTHRLILCDPCAR